MPNRSESNEERLPTRLRGRIRATEFQLNYVSEMSKTTDAGLRYGFAESIVDLEEKLEGLRAEARRLNTDKPEAAAAAGALK